MIEDEDENEDENEDAEDRGSDFQVGAKKMLLHSKNFFCSDLEVGATGRRDARVP